MQTVALNDGVAIPQIGFGTFQIPAGAETEKAVAFALSCGCRHIDTAAAYFNEADVAERSRARSRTHYLNEFFSVHFRFSFLNLQGQPRVRNL